MKPIEKLNKKIAAYKKAYEGLKECESFEGEGSRGFTATRHIGQDLTMLEEIKKDWDMGFITPEELAERL